LYTEDLKISLGIIPVPKRQLIILRVQGQMIRNRIPTSFHDETIEFPPAAFDGAEPLQWVQDHVMQIVAYLIEHGFADPG
jgi:hypothetical protein